MTDNIEMSGGSSPQRSSTSTATVTPPRMNPALAAAIIPSSSSLQSRSTTSTASIAGKSTSAFFLIAVLSGVWLWICNNRIAVSGASVTFAGCLIGLAALVPAFAGQQLSEEALELARWTALKDFVEQCWERKADGHVSADCEKAMDASLPPPPHMDVEKQMSKLVARIPSFQEVNLRITHGYAGIWSSVGIWHLAALLTVYGVLLLLWFQIIGRLRRSELRSLSGNHATLSSGRALALDEEMGEDTRNLPSAHQRNPIESNTSLSQEDMHLTWLGHSPSTVEFHMHPVTSPSEPRALSPQSLPASPLKHPYSGAYYSSGSFAASSSVLDGSSPAASLEMHPEDRASFGQDALFDFDLLPSVPPDSVRERGRDASTQTDSVLPESLYESTIRPMRFKTRRRREHGEEQHTLEADVDRHRRRSSDGDNGSGNSNGNDLDQVSRPMRSRPPRPERQAESIAARQRLRDRLAQPPNLHIARSGIVQRRQSRAPYVVYSESASAVPYTSTLSSSEAYDDTAMSSAIEYQNGLIMNRDTSMDMKMGMEEEMKSDMNPFVTYF